MPEQASETGIRQSTMQTGVLRSHLLDYAFDIILDNVDLIKNYIYIYIAQCCLTGSDDSKRINDK